MLEPESRFFESNRLRLHYAHWGDDDKPALILIHGSRDHARSWDFVAERLVDAFCVYAPDLRGHGDSDWAIGGGYLLGEYVADLAKLLRAIGRGPAFLVGHSMGGRVALDYAAAFPESVRRVVSIEGFGYPTQDSGKPVERLQAYVASQREAEGLQPRAYESIEAASERMLEANRRLTPAMVAHLTRHAVRRREDGQYVWKFDNAVRLRSPHEWQTADTAKIWKEIKRPVLTIGGSESWDRIGPRRALVDEIEGAQTVIVEGAAHWVHHDQIERFVELVREFFLSN